MILAQNPAFALLLTRARPLVELAGDCLSPFEFDKLLEINNRRAAFGEAAQVTPAEMAVVEAAVAGMEAKIRRAIAVLGCQLECGAIPATVIFLKDFPRFA